MQTKQYIWAFFAHAGIIIGMMFVVFFFIDQFLPTMKVLSSELSKWLILCLALVTVINGLFSAKLLFSRQKRRQQKREIQARGR